MENIKIYWPVAKGVFNDVGEKNLTLTAAGVAFFAMFSLFPSLAALIALWGIALDPTAVERQIRPLETLLPQDVFDIIYNQVFNLAQTENEYLSLAGLLGLMLALWSARAGVSAMMRAMNIVHKTPNRSFFRHYFKALFLTFLMVAFTAVGFMMTVGIPILTSFIEFGSFESYILMGVRWTAGTLVLFTAISVLQRYGANRENYKSAWVMPGAIFSTLLAILASTALSTYISHFDSYNKAYGSLGAVAALLMWLYIIALFVLIGAALNARLDMNRPRKAIV